MPALLPPFPVPDPLSIPAVPISRIDPGPQHPLCLCSRPHRVQADEPALARPGAEAAREVRRNDRRCAFLGPLGPLIVALYVCYLIEKQQIYCIIKQSHYSTSSAAPALQH